MTIVRYQMTGKLEKDFGPMTVGELIADRNVLAAIGAPEGVVAVAGGQLLSNSALVKDYPSITLEKQASSKA